MQCMFAHVCDVQKHKITHKYLYWDYANEFEQENRII